MKRRLRIFFYLLILGILLSASAGYYLLKRSLSPVSGRVTAPGLSAPVTVVRDTFGVPHFYANNLTDLGFAVGYVQAQDRLLQIDLSVHLVSGTLSEVIGEDTADLDFYHRTLGFRRWGARALEKLPPEDLALLQAYCKGYNQFVRTHANRLPIDFLILRHTPEEIQPLDLLSSGMQAFWSLSLNFNQEVVGLRIAQKLGADALRELFPAAPATYPFSPSDMQADLYRQVSSELLPGYAQRDGPFAIATGIGASNNWVVTGAKSLSGKPLLANDPHLLIQHPTVWYEMHLNAPGLNVAGVSFPGFLFIGIGHNERIAWGFTNVMTDNLDLYIERVNPENPFQYWDVDHWADMVRDPAPIRIRGESAPRIREVLHTKHGPVITPIKPGLKAILSMRWTAMDPGNTVRAFKQLNHARNWDEALAAVAHLRELSQNLVYGDVDGNIGWHVTGAIPLRARGNGHFPVPGDTGEYEWKGLVPFEELPSVYNPPQPFIITANNKTVDDQYPYTITNSWGSPARYQRIKQLLEEKTSHSVEDFERIQADTYSLTAQRFIEALKDVHTVDPRVRAAVEMLQRWDRRTNSDSAAACLYETLLVKLGENIFGDELGTLYKDFAALFEEFYSALNDIISKPESRWWDDVRTAPKETRGDILERSLKMALADLDARWGSDPQRWHWGTLHTARFIHPLGRVRPLDRFYNLEVLYKGDNSTINSAHFSFNKPYDVTGLSSMRMIVDLADLDRSRIVLTTGQSGNVLSRHFDDQNSLWATNRYHPMFFRPEAVKQHAEGTLTLAPK